MQHQDPFHIVLQVYIARQNAPDLQQAHSNVHKALASSETKLYKCAGDINLVAFVLRHNPVATTETVHLFGTLFNTLYVPPTLFLTTRRLTIDNSMNFEGYVFYYE